MIIFSHVNKRRNIHKIIYCHLYSSLLILAAVNYQISITYLIKGFRITPRIKTYTTSDKDKYCTDNNYPHSRVQLPR